MDKKKKISTAFAPAERAGEKEVQSGRLSATPFLNWFFDPAPDFVLILNKERQIVLANRSFADFLGVKEPNSICGLRPGEALDCIHARKTAGGCGTTEFCSACGALKAILSSQQGKAVVQECLVVRKENGEPLNLRVWAAPLPVEDGPFTLFAIVDVSGEKQHLNNR